MRFFYEKNLYWGIREARKRKVLGTGIYLHRGPVGEQGRGVCFTGDFERQMKEGCRHGALLGEPGGRAPLPGTVKERLIKAVETSVFYIGAQFGEHDVGAPFFGTSRKW